MSNKLFQIFIITLVCVSAMFAQTTTLKAVITPKSWSPKEISDAKLTIPPSQGMRVVGKGELVYLQGTEAANTAITGYAWSISKAPVGSAAKLDSADKKIATFRPDATGDFTIKLSISTAKGSKDTTLVITSAKWVGVGGMDGLETDVEKGQCHWCHFQNFNTWVETPHSEAFKISFDDTSATAHFGENCLPCHTVGYNKDATAVNDGWDDVAAELGWVFPTKNANNYETLITKYTKLAHRANIQCENCHGPGSEHLGNKKHTDVTLASGVCNRCHQSGTRHIIGTQYKEAVHSVGIPEEANRADCAPCHSGSGFILKLDPDNRWAQEHPLGNAPVSCAVCHDPHSMENENQLRTIDNVQLSDTVSVVKQGNKGKLCMTCHHDRRDANDYVKNTANITSRLGPHHSNQADMLAGLNAVDFGMPVGKSSHLAVLENACVDCHMAPTPTTAALGLNELGGHTWRMAWDHDTPTDPSDDIESVGACQSCHGPIKSFEDIEANDDYDGDGTIESVVDEVTGLKTQLAMLLPPVGSPTVVTGAADYSWVGKTEQEAARRKALVKAAYNYRFVDYDGSNGIHNAMYAINLLRRSIAAITKGEIGSGLITSIKDVPGDQGKQVRITWTKFAADGGSDQPVKSYSVWRRVDAPKKTGLGKDIPVIPDLESIKGDLKPGDRVDIADQLWDYVASVPAASMDTYTTVVPTLYDSTKATGKQWSVFKITAHTDLPYWYKVSAPDSGVSIDNLAPVTPANVAVKENAGIVTVLWDKTMDTDVKQYTVYRSSTPGIDPKTAQPLATVSENKFVDANVTIGKTYYYSISATDFAGNESSASREATLMITSVADGSLSGVPTQFTLAQNYPNPFNPSTSIVFGLPNTGQVTIDIYNLQGAHVRSLATGTFAAGYQTVTWDGRDNSGQSVSAGTYLYRLQAEGLALTKKMIYLK
jgi:hypothetical protein